MKVGNAESHVGKRMEGAALVVVMVLVLLLGLLTTAGLRASLFTTNMAANTRIVALALEAAEAALRFCETQALAGNPIVPVLDVPDEGDPTPTKWKDGATWRRPGNLSAAVPAAMLNSESSRQAYQVPPECLAERLRLPTTPGTPAAEGYLITARGFSPDAVLGPDGALRSGSEVWLQSTVRR